MWTEDSIPSPIVTPMLQNTYYISTLDMILSGLLSTYLHIYISTYLRLHKHWSGLFIGQCTCRRHETQLNKSIKCLLSTCPSACHVTNISQECHSSVTLSRLSRCSRVTAFFSQLKRNFQVRLLLCCCSPHPAGWASMHGAEIQLVKSDITTNFATGHCTFIA